MSSWSPSINTISDLREWRDRTRLEIKPDFQRREVWSQAARVMLIDTILKSIPMPKILVASTIKGGRTHRIVIDGQQRIRAILDFLDDEYALSSPYDGEYLGCKFSSLPNPIQNQILQYKMDFNEVVDFSEEDLREVYSRFNKYTFALNKQELRRADYPGDFLNFIQEYSNNEYLDEINLFTIANRRRMGDDEFVSELVAALMRGPLDKKNALDEIYLKYMTWDLEEKRLVKERIESIFDDLRYIFTDELSYPLAKSRFRQKADFYSLFLAIDYFHKYGYSIIGKNVTELVNDLKILDALVTPSSSVRDISNYADRCTSESNSLSSRKWRIAFISNILGGTYIGKLPADTTARLFARITYDSLLDDGMCSPVTITCPICNKEGHYHESPHAFLLSWSPETTEFQISNSKLMHKKCSKDIQGWHVIDTFTEDVLEEKSISMTFDFGQEDFDF